MQLQATIPLFLATLAAANTARYNAAAEAVKPKQLSHGVNFFKQGDRLVFSRVIGRPGKYDFKASSYQLFRIDANSEKAKDKKVELEKAEWYCTVKELNYETELNSTLTGVEIHVAGTRLQVGNTTYSILRDDCGMKLLRQFEEKPR